MQKENYSNLSDHAFKKHIVRIIAIPLVLIFLLMTYSHFQVAYISKLNEDVERLDDIILKTVRFEKMVSEMGTGLRGFIITGKRSFLSPYKNSMARDIDYKEDFFKILKDDTDLIESFNKILFLFSNWKEQTGMMIKARASYNEQVGEKKIIESNLQLSRIRKELASFEQSIYIVKKKKNSDVERAKRTTTVFEIIYIIFLVLTLIVLLAKEVRKATSSYSKVFNDLIESTKKIEEASKAKDLFLANMSHEIRTPLGAVIGFSELAQEDASLNKQTKEYISYVNRNAKHLLALIDDLFDISRITAKKVSISKSDVDIMMLIQDLYNTFKLKASERGVKLSLKIANSLPKKIVTDETKLRQIIGNLIGNSVKFCYENSIIEIILSYDNNLIIVDIIDQGIGIDTHLQSDIFKTFSQVDDSHSRKHGGAGLGLPISKKLANLLGGDVELVTSIKNKGSHFRCFVAGEVAIKSTVDKKINQLSQINKPTDLKGKKILLAEDSVENQILFSIYIESTGAELTVVENGKLAVEEIIKTSYDLAIFDIQMPELGGHEAIIQAREKGIDIPIIALTAHTMKGEKEKCIRNGFNGYLSKPVKKQDLISEMFSFIS